jgi:GH25 family lysozyme M1 (1,4-beta-N-acetylmuramidase)
MINGIDVSHWQGVMDWAKAKAAGVQFAIIRAGSIDANTGVCYTDYQYEANV